VIASFRRRLLAKVLDLLGGLAILATVLALLVGLVAGAVRLGLPRALPPSPPAWLRPKWMTARRLEVGVWLVGSLESVAGRNRRGIGARALGLRRVDARTGGRVAVRSALVRLAFTEARRVLLGRAIRPWSRAQNERAARVAPRAQEIVREHRDDRERRNEAVMKLYRESGTRTAPSCLAPFAASLALTYLTDLPMPWSARGQSLEDWLAGTVVVVER